MENLSELAALIKHHRKKSGLTQNELAMLAGVGKTSVFDAEKGKTTIRMDILLKILHILNIKLIPKSPLSITDKE